MTSPTPDLVRALQSGASAAPRATVLLLGVEPVLQSTRAMILKNAGFDCHSTSELPSTLILMSAMFRAAILCHTLDPMHACAIKKRLQQLSPATAVLRLEKWSRASDPCFEHCLYRPTPSELIAAVQQISFGSKPLAAS